MTAPLKTPENIEDHCRALRYCMEIMTVCLKSNDNLTPETWRAVSKVWDATEWAAGDPFHTRLKDLVEKL